MLWRIGGSRSPIHSTTSVPISVSADAQLLRSVPLFHAAAALLGTVSSVVLMLRSLAILLLLASSAFAQKAVPFAQCADGKCNNRRIVWDAPQLQSIPFPARCRIRSDDGSTGSGTLICRTDSSCIVITAFHVVRDSAETVIVDFPQGSRFLGSVVAKDEFYDLAAIKIGLCDIPPLELSDDLSGTLAAGGFGPDGTFRTVHGSVVGYVSYSQDQNTEQMPVITGKVRAGDSGGAVTNSQKKMVGVIWGEQDGKTYITAGTPLRKLVQEVCGNRSQNLMPLAPIQPRPPVPQQRPPQVAPQPQIDWPAKYEKLESDLAGLQLKFDALQKQTANYKECQCGDCCKQVDAKIAVAIAGIKLPQPQAIDINAIVAQVEQRQQPFYMRVDPRADYQPIKPGQYVTLPLDKLTR